MTPDDVIEYERRLAVRDERRAELARRLGWGQQADRARCRVDEDERSMPEQPARHFVITPGPKPGYVRGRRTGRPFKAAQ